ncbi:hypothetical protein IQ06DRAFT_349783 [Phaeosphaeriaceae sp. SRC1lsM3a]|nr:hypothetical protein IQ06DRAFT_349783 [Stagonospora sp. SRC1lsM3a]
MELTFHEIKNIAHIAHRYDLNHILIGYLDKWLEPHFAHLLDYDYEEWLYVAWQFGLEEQYLTLANHLAVHCEINDRNELLVPSTQGQVFFPSAFPPHTIFLIHICRATALDDIFFMVRAWIEEALSSITCRLPCGIQEQILCSARNSHGLLGYLLRHGLFPMLSDSARETRSVRRIFEIMMSPELKDTLRIGGTNCEHDAACSLAKAVMEGVESLAGKLSWAVDGEMLKAIRRNGASRGLPLSEAKIPARLVGLTKTLGMKDEVKDKVDSDVKIRVKEEPMSE